MRFSTLLDLYRTCPDPHALGRAQAEARVKFKHLVSESPFHLLDTQMDPFVPEAERTIVLGIAVWVAPELVFLDLLWNHFHRVQKAGYSVWVFDVGDIRSQEDFQRLFPSIGKVYQTPFLALFERDQCLKTEQRTKAYAVIYELFGEDLQGMLRDLIGNSRIPYIAFSKEGRVSKEDLWGRS